MTDTIAATDNLPAEIIAPNVCAICAQLGHGPLVRTESLPEGFQQIIKANASLNVEQVCARCVELFYRAQRQIESQSSIFEQYSFVLPLRCAWMLTNDSPERATIAFLIPVFIVIPDLVTPRDRIVAYHSIFLRMATPPLWKPRTSPAGTGMMTSVVAAGNGTLSDGFYRGIASESDLALVKIGRTGRITEIKSAPASNGCWRMPQD
jgi:serine protease AprX